MPTARNVGRRTALIAPVAGAVAVVHLAALRAAGLNGTAPPHSGAFKQLISTLTSNSTWIMGVAIGLILTLVIGVMLAGSQRAPDHFFRVIAAIALLLIGVPALLA